MDTKVCSKCHEEKPLDAFYPRNHKSGVVTYRPECKACGKAASAAAPPRVRKSKKQTPDSKKRTRLRQRKSETYREFQHRVIADAVARARQRLISKGVLAV